MEGIPVPPKGLPLGLGQIWVEVDAYSDGAFQKLSLSELVSTAQCKSYMDPGQEEE